MRAIRHIAGVLGCAAHLWALTPATAAEGGHGAYLMGLRGPGAALAPPEGIFLQNNVYYYEGKNQANRPFPLGGGQTVAGIDAKVRLSLPSITWSTPFEVLGGRVLFSALLPVGGPIVDVGGTVSSPFVRRSISAARSDDIIAVGDPALSSAIAWKSGHFHWSLGLTGFVPVGDYREGALANVANHRAALDPNLAFTWFDPEIGLDVSLAAGVTFNAENRYTRYRTGNEFHIDWAVTQNLTKDFSVGVFGYHYEQLTGDSGPGASLGDFKGRVTALGGTLGYNFKIGALPVSTKLRVFREFNVRNRLEGTGGFFSVSIPLYVPTAAKPGEAVPVVRKY